MTLPVPREAVAALPQYVPGARSGTGATSPVKLSSNENPHDPLPSVRAAVERAAADVHRYPDMFAADLGTAVAARHGIAPDRVALGGGSVAVLGHALQAFCGPGDEIVYAWRSFEAYPILARITGAEPVEVPLGEGARHDLEAMADAVTPRTRAIVVCSPNNPTGPAVHADEFDAFLSAVSPDVLVILDEAYVEFVRDPRAVEGPPRLDGHPNVLVTRTFSKAYGLAGLRVGYALGHPEVIGAVRACTTPFSLSNVAQAAALACLEAEDELLARVEAIVAERDRMVAALAKQGWRVPDAQGNFVWLPCGADAVPLASHLAQASPSILARPFAGDGVRITIGAPEENDHVLAVLKGFATRT